MTEIIETPKGVCPRAGIALRLLAAFTDLISASALVVALLILLGWFDEDLNLLVGLFASLLPWIYALLAVRDDLPSLGGWATSIRRWAYIDLKDYTGKGVLFVRECPAAGTIALRIFGVWGRFTCWLQVSTGYSCDEN